MSTRRTRRSLRTRRQAESSETRRRGLFALILAASGAIPSLAAADGIRICSSCETGLRLTVQEWHCLADDLDLYVNVHSNPVLVSLYGCGKPTMLKDKTRNTQTDITLTPDPTATSNPGEKYRAAFRLSNDQIICLKNNINDILSSPPVLFDFAKTCKGKT